MKKYNVYKRKRGSKTKGFGWELDKSFTDFFEASAYADKLAKELKKDGWEVYLGMSWEQ